MLDRVEQQAAQLGRTVKTVGATVAGTFFIGVDSISMMAGALSAGLTPAQAWQIVLDDMQGSAAGAVNSISDLADETARLAREQAASLSAFQELEGILFNQQMELLSTTEQLEHYEQVLANLAQQKVDSFFGDDNEEQLRIIKEMERVQARINRLKAEQERATTKEEAEVMSEAEATERLGNAQARRAAGGDKKALWEQVVKELRVAKAEYEAAESAKERLAAYEKMARLDDEQYAIWKEMYKPEKGEPDRSDSNDASWFRKVGGAAGGNILGSPAETRREKQMSDMTRAVQNSERATREQTEILRTISNQDGSARL